MSWRREDLPAETVWLLDLVLQGRPYRYASRTIVVIDQDGVEYRYAAGLSEIAAAPGQESVALQVTDALEWEDLWVSGIEFEAQPATLRRHIVGQLIEQSRTYIHGLTAGASFGFPGQPTVLALSIEARTTDAVGSMPSADMHVSNLDSTITIDPQVQTAYAPIIFGYPGLGLYPAYPALYAEHASLPYALVSGKYRAHSGGTIVVFDIDSDGTRESRLYGLDSLPAGVDDREWIDLSSPDAAAFTTTPTFGRRYYAAVLPGTHLEGGSHISERNADGNHVRGAGDVIAWVAERYGHGAFDLQRIQESRASFNDYKIDVAINAPVNGWDWIRGTLLPLLPVDVRTGPAGLYFALRPLTASTTDAVAELVEGRDMDRDGPPSVLNRVANDFTVSYGPSRGGSQMIFTRRLTGDQDAVDRLALTTTSGICYASQLRYGQLTARPMSTRLVWDAGTAAKWLADQAAQYALPWVGIEYTAPTAAEWLVEGAIVSIQDGAFVDRLGVVGPPTAGDGRVRFMVRLFPPELVTQPVDTTATAPPVFTIAPVITGTLNVGDVLTCDGGTVTGGGSLSYQWQRDGVDVSGATSSTYTLVSADLAADMRCIVFAKGAGGTTPAASNELGPVVAGGPAVLFPSRISGTDKYLQDTTAQLTDSGSPDYDYDGDGGSVELECDENAADGTPILTGESVGVPYVYDAVGDAEMTGSAMVGLPATSRDGGFTGFGASNTVHIGDLSTTYRTVAIQFSTDFSANELQLHPSSNGGWSMRSQSNGSGSLRIRAGGATRISFTGLTASYSGVELLAILSITSGGDALAQLYTAAGVPIGTAGTVTGDSVTALCIGGEDMYLGSNSSGNNPADQVTRARLWTAAITVESQMDDIADGTTTSGWARDVTGVRTGVTDPLDSTRLIYEGGTGSDVEAT